MSKYEPLWKKIETHSEDSLVFTFEQIEQILGFAIDHSFLNFKRELTEYGWQVEKISIKGKTVSFSRII